MAIVSKQPLSTSMTDMFHQLDCGVIDFVDSCQISDETLGCREKTTGNYALNGVLLKLTGTMRELDPFEHKPLQIRVDALWDSCNHHVECESVIVKSCR